MNADAHRSEVIAAVVASAPTPPAGVAARLAHVLQLKSETAPAAAPLRAAA